MEMKKISFFSKEKLDKKVKKIVKKYGFEYSKNPDLIICLGGDGTLLLAERLFPGIPKIPIRHKSICKKCASFDINHVLEHIKEGKYFKKTLQKLEVRMSNKKLQSLNDIIIRNKYQWAALRFSLEIDGKKQGDFIGDGIVASTSFGSTAYFQSITGINFKDGFAVALNNIHSGKKYSPRSFKKKITIRVLRERCTISSDNNQKTLDASKGDIITIYPKGKAYILYLHKMKK